MINELIDNLHPYYKMSYQMFTSGIDLTKRIPSFAPLILARQSLKYSQ